MSTSYAVPQINTQEYNFDQYNPSKFNHHNIHFSPKNDINVKNDDYEKLQKELQKYKEKCARLEAKTEEQNNQINDLRTMVRRVANEEGLYLEKAEKKICSLEKEIDAYKCGLKIVEKEAAHFEKIANFWDENINLKKFGKSHMEKVASFWDEFVNE